MSRIHWTPQASKDLDAIHEYVSRDAPAYAGVLIARLIVAVDQLERFVESGRIVPEAGDPALRELIRGPYRIVYQIRDGDAEVITVHHAARPLPPDITDRAG